MKNMKIGFALCGSFCTLADAIDQMQVLADMGAEIYPIMSVNAYGTDTRFGKAEEIRARIESICGRRIIHDIPSAEPIGPKKLLDALLVAPCTGNTLGKLACGITDTPVTLAVKAHLRNDRPVILAIATNDALTASAKNIGELMNRRNIYFVPFAQDDPINKTTSCIADFPKIPQAIENALDGRQIQPLLLQI